MKEVDDQVGVAPYLGVSPRTLEYWRYVGLGPPYVRVGGRTVRYRKADVDSWLQRQTVGVCPA